MQMPQVGELVEVVIDNSFAHSYMNEQAKHRSPASLRLRGVVIETPPWLRDSAALSILNLDNEARNHIPSHRIMSIGGVKFDQKPKTSDLHFKVTSFKTGEVYDVMQNGRTKKWSCTCIGYQFHGRCRHITQIVEMENT